MWKETGQGTRGQRRALKHTHHAICPRRVRANCTELSLLTLTTEFPTSLAPEKRSYFYELYLRLIINVDATGISQTVSAYQQWTAVNGAC